jgi:hypothetical protein
VGEYEEEMKEFEEPANIRADAEMDDSKDHEDSYTG